jgi:hypothetical protein
VDSIFSSLRLQSALFAVSSGRQRFLGKDASAAMAADACCHGYSGGDQNERFAAREAGEADFLTQAINPQ